MYTRINRSTLFALRQLNVDSSYCASASRLALVYFSRSSCLQLVQEREFEVRERLSLSPRFCQGKDPLSVSMDHKRITKSPRKGSGVRTVYTTPRSTLTSDEVSAEIARIKRMTPKLKREAYRCGSKGFVTLEDIPTWNEYKATETKMSSSKASKKTSDSRRSFVMHGILNEKVSLYRGDITSLEIDAIVNAANNSLLGGGGVDGAIHLAAGPFLKKECSLLDGCDTGDAKITFGYNLPARYVIHTVGPIGEKPRDLQSAYSRSLALLKEKKLTSIAFPCISTGIYGYPIVSATHVALGTIRNWLEKEPYANKVDRIVFCVFMKNDVAVYEDLMKIYFPRLNPYKDDADDEDSLAAESPGKKESPDKRTRAKAGKAVDAYSRAEYDDEVGSTDDSSSPDQKSNNSTGPAEGERGRGERDSEGERLGGEELEGVEKSPERGAKAQDRMNESQEVHQPPPSKQVMSPQKAAMP